MGNMNQYDTDGFAVKKGAIDVMGNPGGATVQTPRDNPVPGAVFDDAAAAKVPLTPPYDVADEE